MRRSDRLSGYFQVQGLRSRRTEGKQVKRQKRTMPKPQTTLVVEVPLKEVLDEIRSEIRSIHEAVNKKSDKSDTIIFNAAVQGLGDRILKLEAGGSMAEDIRKQWRATNWQWVTILVAIATSVIALLKR
jgi:hypothetical protein